VSERVTAAIDVGGTKIAIGIVDSQGRILAQDETPASPELGYPAALARTVAILHRLLEESGLSVDGIGIGSTGPIDPETGVYGVVGTLPGWEGSPLAADLEREFGLRVAVENDADAAALGEATWGAGRGSRSLLYVTISTGIGVGILLDGKLYRGAKGAHPEIGHHVIDWSGPLCYCGANGCWETLASGPALEAWMSNQRDVALSASEICELARQGDALALQAVQREALYIGLGLANLVTMYCPQTIVIGGGMMRSADLLLAPALDVVKRICTQVPAENTSIVLAGLGAQCGLLGAACVWFHRASAI
jgi:glucokinase